MDLHLTVAVLVAVGGVVPDDVVAVEPVRRLADRKWRRLDDELTIASRPRRQARRGRRTRTQSPSRRGVGEGRTVRRS
jgi:hypothetical protein